MKLIQKGVVSIASFLSMLETKTKGKTVQLPDYLLAVFLSTYVLTRIIPMPSLLANLLAATAGLLCCAYVFFARCKVPQKACIIFGSLLCVCSVASFLYNGNGSIYYILWVWAFLGVSMLLYSCRLNPKFIMAQFYVFALILALYSLLEGAANSVLAIGSENNLSAYLILYLLVHLISRRNFDAPIALFPIVVAALLTMWTGSRAGLLAVGALLALAFVFNIMKTTEKTKYLALWRRIKGNRRLLAGVVVVVIVAIVLVLTSDFFSAIVQKLTAYGGSSVRTQIWSDYFKAAFENIGNCLLGPNITSSTYPWLQQYPGNPHNAFLSLHAHFGLIPFFLIVIGIVISIIRDIKRKRFLVAIVLAVACIRSFFDWTAFPGPYDVVYFFAITTLFEQVRPKRTIRRSGTETVKKQKTEEPDPNIHISEAVAFVKKCITWCCTTVCLYNVKVRGKNITVNYPCKFTSRTEIGNNCHFNGIEITGSGRCVIGNNFHSGKRVRVLTSFHNYEGGTALPYDDTYIHKDVIIGENVWIGQDVTILAGVTIGEGAVIQAGSVVCKDIPPLAVAGGHPAKAFKYRDEAHYYALKEKQ